MNTIIQTPTPNLNRSLAFYEQLGFTALENSNCVTDGQVAVFINPDRFARAGIRLYRNNWSDTIPKLKLHGPVIETEQGYLLSDASGTWIYLIAGQSDLSNINTSSPSILGNYAGVSLEVIDMESALPLWQRLGFERAAGGVESGWLTLKNEAGFAISLMKPLNCPHLFFNPSLTYFNGGQNPAIISAIRARAIPITEEITIFNDRNEVDNIIIRDPGGLGFFIFND